MMILVAIAVIYYYSLSANNKVKKSPKVKQVSEVNKLLNRDMEKNYPATPREVVDLFSRYLVCYYGENLSDKQLREMVIQSRKMFDKELADKTPLDTQIKNLKEDISKYKSRDNKITTYMVEDSSDVEIQTFDSHYYAKVDTVYYVKGKKGTYRSLETYTLRKDTDGKWKILFWSITEIKEE